jgi:nucleoside-diphosphate-sugar epimerase
MVSTRVGRGEVINIGTGTEYSILDVARMIGGPSEFCEPRLGEAKRTRADIRKAKELLGWEPSISLSEGIQELKESH